VEEPLVRAVLEAEAESFQSTRPIVLLDTTDPWMPADEAPPPRPYQVTEAMWLEWTGPVAPGLRSNNARAHGLGALRTPQFITTFSAAAFDAAWHSSIGLAPLVARLWGKEPLVLSVSRPYLDPAGTEGSILVHVLSTWSGCGGINEFKLERKGGEWRANLRRVLVTW